MSHPFRWNMKIIGLSLQVHVYNNVEYISLLFRILHTRIEKVSMGRHGSEIWCCHMYIMSTKHNLCGNICDEKTTTENNSEWLFEWKSYKHNIKIKFVSLSIILLYFEINHCWFLEMNIKFYIGLESLFRNFVIRHAALELGSNQKITKYIKLF